MVSYHTDSLGGLITEDGYYGKKTGSRIGMTKKILQDKQKLFTGQMNFELKKRIIKCLVWSLAFICTRNVDFNSVDKERTKDVEKWICRRMKKISWTDKVSQTRTY